MHFKRHATVGGVDRQAQQGRCAFLDGHRSAATGFSMRTLVSLLEWLAIRAGADMRRRWVGASGACATAAAGAEVGPDRAGRLVTVPRETLEPVRSLEAQWALWGAVALVVLIVGAGYLRRRLRAAARGAAAARLSARRSGDGGRE